MILRNGETDTALVLKDNTILELKRDGSAFQRSNQATRRTFQDVTAWQASLTSDSVSVTATLPVVSTRVKGAPRTKKIPILARTFQYTADVPHWQIAKDLLENFRCKTDCYVTPTYKVELINTKIALLKLDFDPPQYDTVRFQSPEQARLNLTNDLNWMTAYSLRLTRPNYICASRWNPKVFVKCSDPEQMLSLGVDIPSSQIVVNSNAYKTFGEIASVGSDGLPEFWAFWGKKFTKLSVTIS